MQILFPDCCNEKISLTKISKNLVGTYRPARRQAAAVEWPGWRDKPLKGCSHRSALQERPPAESRRSGRRRQSELACGRGRAASGCTPSSPRAGPGSVPRSDLLTFLFLSATGAFQAP